MSSGPRLPKQQREMGCGEASADRRAQLPSSRQRWWRVVAITRESVRHLAVPRGAAQFGFRTGRMPLSRGRLTSRCCCLPRCRCRCSDARTQIPKGDGAMCWCFRCSAFARGLYYYVSPLETPKVRGVDNSGFLSPTFPTAATHHAGAGE